MGTLPIDLPPPQKRKRRRARRKPVRTVKAPAEQASLLRAPDVHRCGLCGRTVTVLAEAAACPDCGAIISRADRRPGDD